MSKTNDKIQNEHIVLLDIDNADKVDKLWDFFTEHAKGISILFEVQNLLLKVINEPKTEK